MIIYNEKHLALTYFKQEGLLLQVWKGFASSEKFREGIDHVVKTCREHKIKYSISDTLEQQIVKKEDTDYAASKMPVLLSYGLKRLAFVIPKNVFTQMSVRSFSESFGSSEKLDLHFFETQELARKWILEEKNELI